MDFRTRIKELCREKGITQKELAENMGITDIALNKSLRGEYPSLQTLERIAGVLKVQVWELFISRERILPDEASNELRCPHCGEAITIKTSLE